MVALLCFALRALNVATEIIVAMMTIAIDAYTHAVLPWLGCGLVGVLELDCVVCWVLVADVLVVVPEVDVGEVIVLGVVGLDDVCVVVEVVLVVIIVVLVENGLAAPVAVVEVLVVDVGVLMVVVLEIVGVVVVVVAVEVVDVVCDVGGAGRVNSIS